MRRWRESDPTNMLNRRTTVASPVSLRGTSCTGCVLLTLYTAASIDHRRETEAIDDILLLAIRIDVREKSLLDQKVDTLEGAPHGVSLRLQLHRAAAITVAGTNHDATTIYSRNKENTVGETVYLHHSTVSKHRNLGVCRPQ